METNKLRTIVVDDSSLQRMAVSKLINDHPHLDLVAEYNNGMEAYKNVEKNQIDLIFLDVEMPILDGFEFIESLSNIPQIVLITSKPDYALKAFDYDVTDYLLKPITKSRFAASIKKALLKSEKTSLNKADEAHIYVNSNLKKVKVVINEIKWIEGLGDYIKLVTDDSNILVLSTMKAFIEKLPQDKFLRIHKSYIVNLEKIEKFSSAQVEVAGQQIPLSRYKKLQLEEALLNEEQD
ncbi:response regulator transcription factor [Maribacter algarum]|uniref:Response regulator transcription factor n=1 Tax=Maribacter algarum (ex Zhang et al. 2020) TaxID=2578118 RepID=A0A5S3PPW0_9FLAO|nr:LytTR family DNA-binding domain-containing protein [Maribacter algarum]TMM56780.1 response regulator transcription factor [Maribacter algarum]